MYDEREEDSARLVFIDPEADAFSPENYERVLQALDFILDSDTPFGKEVHSELRRRARRNEPLIIYLSSKLPTQTDQMQHRIVIDPGNAARSFISPQQYQKPYLLTEGEAPPAYSPYSDAVVLGHELGHALFAYEDPWRLRGDGRQWEHNDIPRDRNVLLYENQLRRAFGIRARELYHGKPAFFYY